MNFTAEQQRVTQKILKPRPTGLTKDSKVIHGINGLPSSQQK